MREFLVLFLFFILENNECRGDSVEQQSSLATELFKTDKYKKTVSPLYPEYEVLNSSITDEKAATICSNWLARMNQSGRFIKEVKEVIANLAFNCVFREYNLDGSPINATADCISWLHHIYWKDEDYPYEGKCNPELHVNYDSYYGYSTYDYTFDIRYLDNEREMLEDLLTEMTKPPIMVEVSMELVSLNSIDLADSSMDTTIVLFFSWNDPRLSWNRTEYGNTQRIVVDPDLIWTPPIEIVNLDHYGNSGIKNAYSCNVNFRGAVQCSIQISTPGMSIDLLALSIDKWMFKNGQPWRIDKKRSMGYNETNISVLQNFFYDANPAWDFLGYKFDDNINDITGNDDELYSRVQEKV